MFSRTWEGGDEAAFVVRSVAGALSRRAVVQVVVPGVPGPPRPDGLFDIRSVGKGSSLQEWPDPAKSTWSATQTPSVVVLAADDEGARNLHRHLCGDARIVAMPPAAAAQADDTVIAFGPGPGRAIRPTGPAEPGPVHDVGLHVPVNHLAGEHRHNALGFGEYLLVLTDRGGRGPSVVPTGPVAWLTARFPHRHVVLVEGGRAWVWLARALRGSVPIDTRTDLWRLMAHAQAVVDLQPGPLVARECIEALRFGTAVIVPEDSVAAAFVSTGGCLSFRDIAGLLECAAGLSDAGVAEKMGAEGRSAADKRYGRPDAFVERVGKVLRGALR